MKHTVLFCIHQLVLYNAKPISRDKNTSKFVSYMEMSRLKLQKKSEIESRNSLAIVAAIKTYTVILRRKREKIIIPYFKIVRQLAGPITYHVCSYRTSRMGKTYMARFKKLRVISVYSLFVKGAILV